MKKLLLIMFVISVNSVFAQNTFQLWNFNAKPGMEDAISQLAENHWGDAKFKSGVSKLKDMDMVMNHGHTELFFLEK